MKKHIIYTCIGLCLIGSYSCTSHQESTSDNQCCNQSSTFLFHNKTIYSSLLFGTNPVVSLWDINNYSEPTSVKQATIHKHFETNTISFDSICPIKMVQLDSFYVTKEGNDTQINIIHKNRLIAANDEDSSITIISDTAIVIPNDVPPIRITQPTFNECNSIPYCWYKDMEIAWNQDHNNSNGVLVIAAWTGVQIGADTDVSQQPIYHIDLLEDTGYAVLNNDLFQGMPENALVTLILLRGNIFYVTIDGEPVLYDVNDVYIDSGEIAGYVQTFLFSHREELHQIYTLARGSLAYITFVLVRNSYNE